MRDWQIEKEIFKILEEDIVRRKISTQEVKRLQDRLKELIESFPEGARKRRILQKIRDKQRFCYYINDTGILDFTGYGKHFW